MTDGNPATKFSATDLLQFALVSDAAYLSDARNTVEALGMTFIAQLGSPECQALVARWGGLSVVAIQGTRVLEQFSIPEVWDDLDGDIISLSDGTRVHGGFWNPLVALWPRIQPLLPAGTPLLTGHSLGGVRAHLAKALLPEAEVVSFGAPKGGDDAFWTKHYPTAPPVRIVYERDFAPAWPFEGPFTQPSIIGWLHGAQMIEAQKRPGSSFSVTDHSIDLSYIPALRRLKAT